MSDAQNISNAADSVFRKSESVPKDATVVKGPDFNNPIELQSLLESYASIGFQATGLARAIKIVNEMRNWRGDPPGDPLSEDEKGSVRCKIFLGYTSNLVSSGLRDLIRFLVQHKLVSVLVTTAGGIEEDFVRCLGPGTFIPSNDGFSLDGATLRKKGLNRIGNLIVPNDGYCRLEDWVMPLFDQMLLEQVNDSVIWSPSTLIQRLGEAINDETSIYYWAAKNEIPVFCPALTDGSLGDMMYFHSYKNPGLILDIISDIRRLNNLAVHCPKAGIVILGGGVCKHQICNAMLFRNGADFAVYINTGQEFDGSDSGARPDEAVSWGKIRSDAQTVKVYADATLIFPLLVAATWGRNHWENLSQSV